MRWRAIATLVLIAATGVMSTASAAGHPGSRSATVIPDPGHGYAPSIDIEAGGPIHGVILTDANTPFDVTTPDLAHLAAEGVNLVTLYVTQYVTAPDGSAVSAGRFTPTDEEVNAAVAAAHEFGIAVQLTPVLWSRNGYLWRGGLQPSNRGDFWRSYDAMILHYAALAQTSRVELFSLGSENDSLEPDVAEWRQLASQVRRAYSGLTTYMTTTTDLRTVRFWSSVDLMAVSPYYNLSPLPRPSYAQLRRGWAHWMSYLAAVSRHFRRPILFNETGYDSALGTTAKPWVQSTQAPSEGLQADAYAAVLDAAAGQEWLRGVVFYKWTPPVADPSLDRSYTPREKQAECAYAGRWAPPTTPRLPDGTPTTCLTGFLDKAAGGQ